MFKVFRTVQTKISMQRCLKVWLLGWIWLDHQGLSKFFAELFVSPCFTFRIRQMLGNIEDIKDYHKRVMLPRMEEAVKDVTLMR